jgi:hypothetical protein
VLRTSTELPADEVALAYKSLWQAGRLFRTVEGPLSWRPVYLWTEKRVRGRLAACFLALGGESELFLRLAAQEGERPSYPEVVSDLKALSAVDLTIGGQRYLARTELRHYAHAAFRPPASAHHPESSPFRCQRSGTSPDPRAFPCKGAGSRYRTVKDAHNAAWAASSMFDASPACPQAKRSGTNTRPNGRRSCD